MEKSILHINTIINDIKNIEHKNTIRLYIYKIFRFYTKDEKEFLTFDYNNKNISFFNDFEIVKSQKILSHYSFPCKSLLKTEYSKVLNLFKKYTEENYNDEDKKNEFKNQIKDFPIEIFVNITINTLITKIGIKSYFNENKNDKKDKNDERCSNFLKFAKDILGSSNNPQKMSKLLIMYYDKDIFKKKLSNKLDEEGFFISLYGLRYCLNSLKNDTEKEKEKNNLYTSLFHKKKYKLPAEKSQIPGSHPLKNIPLIVNKILVKKMVENSLSKNRREIFLEKYKNVITIRYLVLNFILVSYLFFSECLGNLGNKKSEILPEVKDEKDDLLNIMKNDFKELSAHLKLEYIDSVEIFMNLIYEEVCDLIINSDKFLDKKETEKFENKVDEIIIGAIDKYNVYKAEYIKENYDFLEKEEKENDKNYLLVKELIPIEELSKNEKYFMLTKFHSEEERENGKEKHYFENYLLKVGLNECREKYPLLYRVVFYKEEVENLKYLPDINNFCNYLINKFSHKISRKEANNKEISHNDFGINQNLFEKFLNSWNKLNDKKISLSKDSPLINFLIDKEELAKTNPINIAFYDFIRLQNNFLTSIVNPSENKENKNDILYFYFDTIKKTINVQDSKNNQIDLSGINMNSLIIKNSKRNIFNKGNNDIDYSNYNSFIYDLDSIEKELGEKILPGKCLFEEKIKRHMIFWNEGNKEILTMLVNRYEQKKLDDKEKEKLLNFVKKNYLGERSMKELYESFFILFFYLNEDKNELNLKNNLNSLLQLIPPDLNLSEDFNNFLKKEGENIGLNKLFEIFLYLEHLYFEINHKNIEEEYLKQEIKDIAKIKSTIEKLKISNEFSKALRRYITRYILGNKNLSDNFKEDNLINEFYKSDLWGIQEMKKFDNINHILNSELNYIDIKIGQAFSLYENIGKEDRESVSEFVKEIESKNEDEEAEKEDDETLD